MNPVDPVRIETHHGFSLRNLIGAGQYGSVFEAFKDGKRYAVKKLADFLQDGGVSQVTLAFGEITRLRDMTHPFVVGYVDHFLVNGQAYIVMDYCDGISLKTKISTNATVGEMFTEGQIKEWIVQLAFALFHVHEKAIIHRDLKANNIFLTNDGYVKLGDFSVVKVLSPDASVAMTRRRTEENYRAPEMWQGKPYRCNVDIWSLGCLLFELMALRPPFGSAAPGSLALMDKIMRGAYDADLLERDKFPQMFEVMTNLLIQTPEERPSAADILNMPLLQDTVDRMCRIFNLNRVSVFESTATTVDTGDDEFPSVDPDPQGWYPIVNWGEAQNSQSRQIWFNMVTGAGGTLEFPPLNLPANLGGVTILLRFVRRDARTSTNHPESADVPSTSYSPRRDMRLWVQSRSAVEGTSQQLRFAVTIKIPKLDGSEHQFHRANMLITVTSHMLLLHCQQVFPWDTFDPERPPSAKVQIKSGSLH